MPTLEDLVSLDMVAALHGASQDPAFLAAFLADPKGAYRKRFGAELLPGYDVTVEPLADGSARFFVPGMSGQVIAHGASAGTGELKFP